MTAAAADLLGLLRRSFAPGAETDTVDADVPLDVVLAWLSTRPGGLHRLAAVLDELLEDHPDPRCGDARLAAALGLGVPLPAGGTWHAWARYARDRTASAAGRARGGRHLPRPAAELLLPPRASTFLDGATMRAAVERTLTIEEERVHAWLAGVDEPSRLALVTDLGTTVGRVLEAPRGRLPVSTPVRSCAVLLARDDGPPGCRVVAAHPELGPPAGPRERFADLTSLFGGTFGQSWRALSGDSAWQAERSLHATLSPGVRQRYLTGLDNLLDRPDDDLGVCVDALGSYLRPLGLRRWVAGLRRRMAELDWTPSDRTPSDRTPSDRAPTREHS